MLLKVLQMILKLIFVISAIIILLLDSDEVI